MLHRHVPKSKTNVEAEAIISIMVREYLYVVAKSTSNKHPSKFGNWHLCRHSLVFKSVAADVLEGQSLRPQAQQLGSDVLEDGFLFFESGLRRRLSNLGIGVKVSGFTT